MQIYWYRSVSNGYQSRRRSQARVLSGVTAGRFDKPFNCVNVYYCCTREPRKTCQRNAWRTVRPPSNAAITIAIRLQLRLRSDYDVSRAPASNSTQAKMNVIFSSYSRIAVESQLWYRLNANVIVRRSVYALRSASGNRNLFSRIATFTISEIYMSLAIKKLPNADYLCRAAISTEQYNSVCRVLTSVGRRCGGVDVCHVFFTAARGRVPLGRWLDWAARWMIGEPCPSVRHVRGSYLLDSFEGRSTSISFTLRRR